MAADMSCLAGDASFTAAKTLCLRFECKINPLLIDLPDVRSLSIIARKAYTRGLSSTYCRASEFLDEKLKKAYPGLLTSNIPVEARTMQ